MLQKIQKSLGLSKGKAIITIIDLIVGIIAVIGLIATILLPNLMSLQTKLLEPIIIVCFFTLMISGTIFILIMAMAYSKDNEKLAHDIARLYKLSNYKDSKK